MPTHYLSSETYSVLVVSLHFIILVEFATFRVTFPRSGMTDPKTKISQIEIYFVNGMKKKMILNQYNSIPNSVNIDHSRICNYLGHLEGDKTSSTVAVTGCLFGENPDEKVDITLLSKYSPLHKTFSLDLHGNVRYIPTVSDYAFMSKFSSIYEPLNTSPRTPVGLHENASVDGSSFISESSKDYAWRPVGGDAFTNEEIETAAATVNYEQRNNVVGRRILRFRLGYDRSVRDYFTQNSEQTVDNWLAEVMTHTQAHYLHSSLANKIIFEVPIDRNHSVV